MPIVSNIQSSYNVQILYLPLNLNISGYQQVKTSEINNVEIDGKTDYSEPGRLWRRNTEIVEVTV